MPDPRPRTRLALAALAGAGAGLGQVPFALTPVALAALVVLGWLCRTASRPARAAWIGFAGGVGYFAFCLHWIVEPFLVEPEIHGWMAPFALVLISTGFALFWAAAFWGARRLSASGWRFALSFGAALGAAEMTRSLILTGFPWSLIGYVWSETPAAQIAAFTGPFGLTALTALGAGAVAALWAPGRRIAAAAGLAGLCVLPLALGALRLGDLPAIPVDAPIVRLVQPNAPQDEKWDPVLSGVFYDRLLDLTAGGARPALIVWPETALPVLLTPGAPELAQIAEAADGVPVALGANRAEGLRYWNSLAVIGRGGKILATYDKWHLVPFGEYVPLGRLASGLGLRGLAARDGFGYAAGPGPQILDLGAAGEVIPLICYEAIFPEEVGAAPTRPDWLLHVTNDAWFGTFAGPQQHLAQARMRAIEQGLPLLRAANTGISAVIDGKGRVLDAIPLGRAGRLDHPVPAALPPTVYARIGDWPAALAMALALLAAGLRRRRPAELP